MLGVLSLGSALALAGIAAWLITRAWQMPPVLDLSVAAVAVRALGISRGVLGYCQRLAVHDTALRAAGEARTGLYRRLAAAPPDVAMRLNSGELVSRIGSSVDELAEVIVRAVLPMAVAAVLGVAAVAVLAVISPPAAVVLALCLLAAGVVAPVVSGRAVAAAEAAGVAAHAQRDAAVVLALDHAAELRVSGRLESVIAEAAQRRHAWGAAADRSAARSARAGAVPTAATGVAVIGGACAAIALAGGVAPTTSAILMLLPLSAFEATAALPAAAVALSRSRIAARRLADLVEPDAAGRRRPALTPVPLRRGDRVLVTGPSGSGKTTLLMAMAEQPDGAAGARAFFAEDAHLFSTTLRDNLLVARGDASDAELRDALRRVGLLPWLEQLPEGLSTVLTGGAAAVSAGQRRRLLLARALVSAFPVVLLDEPTEHLDADDATQILTDLLTPAALFPAERTVVVATHQRPPDLDGYQQVRTAD
ncbi:ATP-binding cassette domain-containing protein [Mycobacterium sp. WMMD1722]|uniref:ATP-binding cassette domain-containing protein n=1 Tax=Mycobacterium sp. WMMD1722 TaxID=3404117 RepID=UPI003BF56862